MMSPDELRAALTELARNLRWSWDERIRIILDTVPTAAPNQHPSRAVGALNDDQLTALSQDAPWCERLQIGLAIAAHDRSTAADRPRIAYYSPEFGISELLPQYSGGLGILAGDHLKASSDLGLGLVGVGLFYRQGFFHQDVTGGGQTEWYESVEPGDLGGIDTGVVVGVPIGHRTVFARVWRFDIGRIPLIVLDTEVELNDERDRAITDRLYSGDRRHRLEQELVLGIGGARALAALGWTPEIHHLNEGHAGFLTFELIDRAILDGASFEAALERVREQVLFTTHTPVTAGIDRFDRSLIDEVLMVFAQSWNIDLDRVAGLGADPDNAAVFNMAALALGLSDRANGVSQLHGAVSRTLFAGIRGGPAIGSITNGVHARTWVAPVLQELFDEYLGEGWDMGEPEPWSRVGRLSDGLLVPVRRRMRGRLEELVERQTGHRLDEGSLVIGFARRFATYKRATLLLRQYDALCALLADTERPVHFVFAGKAHPADGDGKELLAQVLAFSRGEAANGRFSFIADYDMGIARALYHGCDVWLNTPVRPHEASGTSGEKAALNGVLNCSIRDGWWAEMSDGYNGWDIPLSDAIESGRGDEVRRDHEEAAALIAVFATILDEFHADTGAGPSAAWWERMRHNWRTLGPQVTAARMVREYERIFYTPMLHSRLR